MSYVCILVLTVSICKYCCVVAIMCFCAIVTLIMISCSLTDVVWAVPTCFQEFDGSDLCIIRVVMEVTSA